MLSLSNITHTIWEYANGWYIVEAMSGSWGEATDRADELKTLYPDCTYAVHTAYPVNDEECLKQSKHYGKVRA